MIHIWIEVDWVPLQGLNVLFIGSNWKVLLQLLFWRRKIILVPNFWILHPHHNPFNASIGGLEHCTHFFTIKRMEGNVQLRDVLGDFCKRSYSRFTTRLWLKLLFNLWNCKVWKILFTWKMQGGFGNMLL